MSIGETKTNAAWNALFAKYDIAKHVRDDGSFLISADQIREFREPRLMAKFDHWKDLPDAFRKNGLGILPVTRGDYRIGPFDLYAPIRRLAGSPKPIVLSGSLETLSGTSVTSETIALNLAFQSGITKTFLGNEDLQPTAPGRMGATPFGFRVRSTLPGGFSDIATNGVQIEIDAAYESWSSLILVEAKLGDPDDFLIRQLFYPYRHFLNTGVTKSLRPVFFTYSRGIFTLREYRFSDKNCYNSLSEINSEQFIIETTKMTRDELAGIMARTAPIIDPSDIPFPQANDIGKIIDLCDNIMVSGPMSKMDVEGFFGFTGRQADYYLNAAKYLGVVSYDPRRYPHARLTQDGTILASCSGVSRERILSSLIMKHPAFREALHISLMRGTIPETGEIRTILLRTNPGIGAATNDTFGRRASTIRSWIQWMFGLINP